MRLFCIISGMDLSFLRIGELLMNKMGTLLKMFHLPIMWPM